MGNNIRRCVLTVTGLSPSPAPPSKGLHLHTHFLTAHQAGRPNTVAPTTPQMQPLPGITHLRFSLIRFRSPLLSESQLFSLPMGTEMFHFPTFPPHALYIQAQVTGHDSSWVSPFGHPRITARLPTPQGLSQAPTSFIGSRCQGIHHVPFTACRHQHRTTPLTRHDQRRRTTRHKRNSHNNHPPHPTPDSTSETRPATGHHAQIQNPPTTRHTPKVPAPVSRRCSRPLSTSQTTTPHHPPPDNPHRGQRLTAVWPGTKPRSPTRPPTKAGRGAGEASEPQQCAPTPQSPRGQASTELPLTNTTKTPARSRPDKTAGRTHHGQGCVLLRKEVIQPHLPVRLPCYDFVPIASPTFDHSLQQAGWAMGFGCCRLS